MCSQAILGEYKSQVEKLKGQLAKTREKCKSMQADEVKRVRTRTPHPLPLPRLRARRAALGTDLAPRWLVQTREGSKDAQRVKDLEADVQVCTASSTAGVAATTTGCRYAVHAARMTVRN